ncbi:hypothetical protein QEV13_00060 [Trueperella pyogenes]|uniref:hypothetical protein n=1 Tax=Trueperella pyogenes TaxID=1661 RepID=UPI0024BF40F7|nr:hypothetical protein [Trueperella pyogenes]WHU61086.1 hypothetical protein QEV13_00060 [Trueperella pyogenes]
MNVKSSLAMKMAMAATLSGAVVMGGVTSAVAAPVENAPVVACISAEDKAQAVETLKAMVKKATADRDAAMAKAELARTQVAEATKARDAVKRDADRLAKDLENKTRALETAKAAEAAAKKALDEAVKAEKIAMDAYEAYKKVDADAVNKEFDAASNEFAQQLNRKTAFEDTKKLFDEAKAKYRALVAEEASRQEDLNAATNTLIQISKQIKAAKEILNGNGVDYFEAEVKAARKLLTEAEDKLAKAPTDPQLKAQRDEVVGHLKNAEYHYDKAVVADKVLEEARTTQPKADENLEKARKALSLTEEELARAVEHEQKVNALYEAAQENYKPDAFKAAQERLAKAKAAKDNLDALEKRMKETNKASIAAGDANVLRDALKKATDELKAAEAAVPAAKAAHDQALATLAEAEKALKVATDGAGVVEKALADAEAALAKAAKDLATAEAREICKTEPKMGKVVPEAKPAPSNPSGPAAAGNSSPTAKSADSAKKAPAGNAKAPAGTVIAQKDAGSKKLAYTGASAESAAAVALASLLGGLGLFAAARPRHRREN